VVALHRQRIGKHRAREPCSVLAGSTKLGSRRAPEWISL
jgi:hypothetical protein